jgi:uncharacterized protein YcbX
MVQLTSLFVYPVKSCRGIALDASEFGPDGLLHDREFLVVDGEGRFITQRTVPRLALIETGLSADALILRAPESEELRVPWQIPAHASVETPVTIWHDRVLAADTGDAAAAWFTRALGQPCRLVRRGPAYTRFLPTTRIPAQARTAVEQVPVSFADAFPALVISEESLSDLNERLDDPIPMDRFRPNLVLRGCSAPYAEDTWAAFRVGESAKMHAGGVCVRCTIPSIDQQLGVSQGKEPLRTLALYRRSDAGGVIFGQNIIPEGSGQLRVGDTVEILASA